MGKKQTEQLLLGGALVVAAVFLLGLGQTPMSISDGGTTTTATDGSITIQTGTPTLEWVAVKATTGQQINAAHFRVTINGMTKDYTNLGGGSADASMSDPYTICLMPNASYYGTCESGTVSKVVQKVQIEAEAIGSVTAWIDNDASNSTQRNAYASPDVLANGASLNPTLCFKGATALASFGDGAVLVGIDYNSAQLSEAPTWSAGELRNDLRPPAYDTNSDMTTSVFYLVEGTLGVNDTVCGTMNVTNGTLDSTIGGQNDVNVQIIDRAYYRRSDTDALEQGYARPTTGIDTNTASNGTVQYFIT